MVKSQSTNAVYAKVNAVTRVIYTLKVSGPLLGFLQQRFELELGGLSEKSLLNSINLYPIKSIGILD